MKTTYSFLIELADAATTFVKSMNGVQVSQGSGLSGFIAKRGGFRMRFHSTGTDMGPATKQSQDKALQQSTSSSIMASQVTRRGRFRMPGRRRDERLHGIGTNMKPAIGRSQIISSKRNLKVCERNGQCHHKILVCPKCGKLNRSEKKHLHGKCIFNCMKCTTHC